MSVRAIVRPSTTATRGERLQDVWRVSRRENEAARIRMVEKLEHTDSHANCSRRRADGGDPQNDRALL